MIFGTGAPKFIASDNAEILLDYFVYGDDEPQPNYRVAQSVMNRHREIVNTDEHYIFNGTIYLYKYGIDPVTLIIDTETVRNRYNEINGYKYDEVTLYRHRDGEPMKDSNGDIIKFYLTELKTFYLNTVRFEIAAFIEFISVDPCVMAESLTNIITDDTGETITDDTGELIKD